MPGKLKGRYFIGKRWESATHRASTRASAQAIAARTGGRVYVAEPLSESDREHRAMGRPLVNPLSHRELTALQDEAHAAEWAVSGMPQAHWEVAMYLAGAAHERAADLAEKLQRRMGRYAPEVKAAKSASRRAFKAYLAAIQAHQEFCNRLDDRQRNPRGHW